MLRSFIDFRLGYDLLVAMIIAIPVLKIINIYENSAVFFGCLVVGLIVFVLASRLYLRFPQKVQVGLNILGYSLLILVPMFLYSKL